MNFLNCSLFPEADGIFQHIIVSLVLSSVLSLLAARVYMAVHKEKGYSQTFVHTLVLFAVIVTAVMAIIGNDLARAFGLVGAVSIVRFRTKVKDPLDMGFLFFVITIGMANGLRLYMLSIITALFVSMLIIIMHKTKFGLNSNKDDG